MEINKIIKTAKRFKRKTGGLPTFENAREYIKSRGFTVILFDDDTEEVYSYGLKDILSDKEAYTYLQNIKVILIRKSLDAETKLKRLLHEIGHIELKHLYNDVLTPDDKEHEAETFAYYALQSSLHTDIKNKVAITVLSVCLGISLLFNGFQYKDRTESELTAQTQALSVAEENYYVTKTGSKYHNKNCIYAANGKAVTEEYAKSHYEPCKICNP